MSKKIAPKKYLEVATFDEIARIEEKINEINRASRKPREPKIERYIGTVVRCLRSGKSQRRTTEIVNQLYSGSISRESVRRFALTLKPSADMPKTKAKDQSLMLKELAE